MIWTAILKGFYRVALGRLPEGEPEAPDAGLVIVADGVGGLDLCGVGMQHAAACAGLPHAVRVLRWGHGFGRWYRDLSNVDNHTGQGAELARQVREFRDARPGAPVFLVGKSGGSGIVVRALEQLPAGAVEAVVLLAPALSPTYDLSAALRAVRGEMTVFWSPLDLVVLGLGTKVFGTVDRVRSVSAGLIGFRQPPGADAAAYARLRQTRWRLRMGAAGYLGGHVGPDHPTFLRRYVVPLLTVATQSDAPSAGVSSPARRADNVMARHETPGTNTAPRPLRGAARPAGPPS